MSNRSLSRRLSLGAAGLATVMALCALPAAQAAGNSRMATGRTSQGRNVRVRLQGGRWLKVIRFTARLGCHDGGVLIDQESGFQPIRLRRGRFSSVQVGNTDTVRLRGRAGDRVVRGRIRVGDRWGHVRCDSRWIRFSARVR